MSAPRERAHLRRSGTRWLVEATVGRDATGRPVRRCYCAEAPVKDRRLMTVEAALSEWVDGQVARKVNPRTVDLHRECCRKWIIPTIGEFRLTAVAAEDVERVQQGMRDAGLAEVTVLLARRVMARAFR